MNDNKYMLTRAQAYANFNSTCEKVQVGSLIITEKYEFVYGSNNGVGAFSCKAAGCHRVKVYGDNSKLHRLPSDCMSIHSEVDAISRAAKEGVDLNNAVIFVTRYPCEACARAIAAAGIRKVVYGRKEMISNMTRTLLEFNGVEVVHESEWDYEDNNS